MSNFKYYDTLTINKLSPVKRIKARRSNLTYFKKQDKLYGDILIINEYPLDDIQKQVVYSDDKYTMVIAGAGAGKSTTMIGKMKYLVNVKKIDPGEIIAISFTNESVNSLKRSLEKNGVFDINVLTFHKLALSFIKKPNIIPSDYLEYIVKEYLLSNNYSEKSTLILKAFKLNDYQEIINHIDNYIKMIVKVINLCHTNNYQTKDFIKARNIILKKVFWKRLYLLSMLYVVMDIFYIYEAEKEAIEALDFDDMIIKATEVIKNYHLKYKYIIVDEYQDTSLIRVKLLQEIIKYSNAKLLVVGDDYQSIYRFNGCDLNIFLNFRRYFPYPKIFKLQNTYRNSQELINISKNFIIKNPYQIRKKLVSKKHLNNPIKIVYYTDQNKDYLLNKLVTYIKNNYGNCLILGRNNFDIRSFTNNNYNYLTVHKSKGLEEDNIIIINLENNLYGFPNQVKDLEIEKLLIKNNHYFPFDEERRLFYVALTRTKNYVFLFVNKKNSSIFIEELIKSFSVELFRF